MKCCVGCTKDLPVGLFDKDRTKKGGYYSICKDCRRKRTGAKKMKRCVIIGEWKDKRISLGKGAYPYICGTKIRAHRYIMEDILGRKLDSKEHVHHIDGNKINYYPENLAVLNKSDHHKLHPTPKGEGKFAKCQCGKEVWLNRYELTHRYGNNPERYLLYKCVKCGGGGAKKKS